MLSLSVIFGLRLQNIQCQCEDYLLLLSVIIVLTIESKTEPRNRYKKYEVKLWQLIEESCTLELR